MQNNEKYREASKRIQRCLKEAGEFIVDVGCSAVFPVLTALFGVLIGLIIFVFRKPRR